MKQLNTLPIEQYLDKARIAIKSNQKNLTLTISEVIALYDSLAVAMTRISGELDKIVTTPRADPGIISVNMDGGTL